MANVVAMSSIFNELKELKMNTLELIKDAALFGGTVPNERVQEVKDYLKKVEQLMNAQEQVKNIAYEPVLTTVIYKQSFIDRFNKYFEYKPKTYEYVGKNSKREYTLDDLHKEYEKAMGETPFNRG